MPRRIITHIAEQFYDILCYLAQPQRGGLISMTYNSYNMRLLMRELWKSAVEMWVIWWWLDITLPVAPSRIIDGRRSVDDG